MELLLPGQCASISPLVGILPRFFEALPPQSTSAIYINRWSEHRRQA